MTCRTAPARQPFPISHPTSHPLAGPTSRSQANAFGRNAGRTPGVCLRMLGVDPQYMSTLPFIKSTYIISCILPTNIQLLSLRPSSLASEGPALRGFPHLILGKEVLSMEEPGLARSLFKRPHSRQVPSRSASAPWRHWSTINVQRSTNFAGKVAV